MESLRGTETSRTRANDQYIHINHPVLTVNSQVVGGIDEAYDWEVWLEPFIVAPDEGAGHSDECRLCIYNRNLGCAWQQNEKSRILAGL